jgi:hypothetical protein
VQWPSGIIQNVDGLNLNEYKNVIEDTTLVSVNTESNQLPTDFQLYQNYPNPFNPSTNIGFQIEESGLVTLKVYDVLGNELATLLDEEKERGSYSVQFNTSSVNHLPSSGMYFYTLKTGNYSETKKMILLK